MSGVMIDRKERKQSSRRRHGNKETSHVSQFLVVYRRPSGQAATELLKLGNVVSHQFESSRLRHRTYWNCRKDEAGCVCSDPSAWDMFQSVLVRDGFGTQSGISKADRPEPVPTAQHTEYMRVMTITLLCCDPTNLPN